VFALGEFEIDRIMAQSPHRPKNGQAHLVAQILLERPMFQTHPQAKQTPAHRLVDWLASPEGQTAIANYTKGGRKLFHPQADPKP
jgi:hypothetical protein